MSLRFADCEQLMGLLASGSADSSLSVRIPTAAALAALSEALRDLPRSQTSRIGLHAAAKSAHFLATRVCRIRV